MDSNQSPNIVMVVMDTARAQNLSCYGHDRKTTPFLDSLAEENTKYENAVVQENWTFPSHASIFSGEYASEHKIIDSGSYLDVESFTQELSANGYETIGLTNVAYLSPEFDFDKLFDEFEYIPSGDFFEDLEIDREDFYSEKSVLKYGRLFSGLLESDKVGEKIKEGTEKLLGRKFLLRDSGARKTNRLAKEKVSSSESPFFLFLNYVEPHSPYLPPLPYSHKFLSWTTSFGKIEDFATKNWNKYMQEGIEPEEEELEFVRTLYDSEISYLDSKLEELYDFITKSHPNTVFIFLSDHGEMFYENGMFRHKTGGFFKELKEVPLIEVVPGEDANTFRKPVELKNISEHIISLSKGEFNPIKTDGLALSEDIGPEEEREDNPVRRNYGYYGVSVQDEEHKFVWYSSGKKELLSLPEEKKLEDDKKAQELKQVVLDRVGNPETNDYRNKEETEADDEEIKKRLEYLGYN